MSYYELKSCKAATVVSETWQLRPERTSICLIVLVGAREQYSKFGYSKWRF